LDIFRRSRSGRDITRHVIESVKEHHKVLPIDGVFAEDAHERSNENKVSYAFRGRD